MLDQQQVATLLIRVAVSTSIASILMRFASIQKILLREERTVVDRVKLALLFSVLFGASAAFRILSRDQYPAIDLSLEGAVIAGMLGGYVSGLITGLCVSVPDMCTEHWMSMPLFAAAGLIGALIHDLAPREEDIWYFSPFIDLNLYRLLRQIILLKRQAIKPLVIRRAAFNSICNVLVVLAESLRWGVYMLFSRHGTFFPFAGKPPEPSLLGPVVFFASAASTLFAVALPIRVWSSFRAERQLAAQTASLMEARLTALTNQINPHFLFNTLNSVSSLIRIDPDRARGMIYRLSKILRRLLRKTENFAPLREEISFIDDYLAIEMVRFGDKLRFQKDIQENTLDRLVPSMILQPIVENSIRHGLSSKVEGGTVKLHTWLEGSRLHILIEDDGVGVQESKLATLFQQGIGVSNVNERLRVLFGTGYRMSIDSTPGQGTQTLIEIPELENIAETETEASASLG